MSEKKEDITEVVGDATSAAARNEMDQDKAAMDLVMNDPEMNDWLSKKAAKEGGDVDSAKTISDIINDPETNDWLSKKEAKEACTVDEEKVINDIINDPETNDWISKKKASGEEYTDKAIVQEITSKVALPT